MYSFFIAIKSYNMAMAVYIEYAIIDKDVTITPGATLVGGLSSPVIVHKGNTI